MGDCSAVICPAAEESIEALGVPKLVEFHTLKPSALTSILVASRLRNVGKLKTLDIDQSALIKFGPRSEPTEAYPKRQHVGTAKAPGLYHCAADCPPGTL